MKKALSFAIVLSCALSLCSCGYREIDAQYVAASLFVWGDETVNVCVEMIGTDGQEKSEFISFSAADYKAAFGGLCSSLPYRISLSHLAAIIVDENCVLSTLGDIKQTRDINPAARVAVSAETESLIKASYSGTAIGFDILSLIKKDKSRDFKLALSNSGSDFAKLKLYNGRVVLA